MKLSIAAFVLSLSAASTADIAPAHAQDLDTETLAVPVAGPRVRGRLGAARGELDGDGRHWYGWEGLLFDAGAAVVLAPSLAVLLKSGNDSTTTALAAVGSAAGAGSFAFGFPIVHALHGRTGAAWGSFAMRAATLGAAGGIYAAANDGFFRKAAPMFGIVTGLIVGGVAVSVDASALPFEKETAEARDAAARRGSPRVVSVAPTVDPTGGGGGLSLAGVF